MMIGFVPLLIVAAAMFVGCAQEMADSGFLRDYSALKPNPAMDGALYYQHPSKSLKEYRRFIIEPVVIHFAPNAAGTGIDPDELKELADYWREEAVKALSQRYQVVTVPGPGVLRIRAAITGIKKTTAVFNIHPAMKASGIGLGGASMEAEALDSQTGERIVAVVDSRMGSRLGVVSGLQTYGHAKEVLGFWVDRFVTRLDEAHGYTGK